MDNGAGRPISFQADRVEIVLFPPANPQITLEDLRKISASIKSLYQDLLHGILATAFIQGSSPTVGEGQGILWLASGTGTLDGQAYDQGDLLYTAKFSGTQKTILIIDWSLY